MRGKTRNLSAPYLLSLRQSFNTHVPHTSMISLGLSDSRSFSIVLSACSPSGCLSLSCKPGTAAKSMRHSLTPSSPPPMPPCQKFEEPFNDILVSSEIGLVWAVESTCAEARMLPYHMSPAFILSFDPEFKGHGGAQLFQGSPKVIHLRGVSNSNYPASPPESLSLRGVSVFVPVWGARWRGVVAYACSLQRTSCG